MITFIEHYEPGYPARTIVNAQKADLTLAFAVDFDSPGEKLTHKAAYGKYHRIDLRELAECNNYNRLIESIKLPQKSVITLNIAGNSIYTLKDVISDWDPANHIQLKFTQKVVDELMRSFLYYFTCSTDKKFQIRTGGQTGADEAGAKAGERLGLPTTVLAPKGWMYLDITGKDICDEAQFLARFGEKYDVTNLL